MYPRARAGRKRGGVVYGGEIPAYAGMTVMGRGQAIGYAEGRGVSARARGRMGAWRGETYDEQRRDGKAGAANGDADSVGR